MVVEDDEVRDLEYEVYWVALGDDDPVMSNMSAELFERERAASQISEVVNGDAVLPALGQEQLTAMYASALDEGQLEKKVREAKKEFRSASETQAMMEELGHETVRLRSEQLVWLSSYKR